jgi:hypothetical protein
MALHSAWMLGDRRVTQTQQGQDGHVKKPRFKWCSHKPRNASHHHKQEKARRSLQNSFRGGTNMPTLLTSSLPTGRKYLSVTKNHPVSSKVLCYSQKHLIQEVIWEMLLYPEKWKIRETNYLDTIIQPYFVLLHCFKGIKTVQKKIDQMQKRMQQY